MDLVRIRPRVFVAEHGYRSLLVIGTAIAALGLWLVGAGLGWLPSAADARSDDLIGGGAIVSAVAVAVATYRQGFRLDRDRRLAVRYTRILGVRLTKHADLDRVRAVAVSSRLVRAARTRSTASFVELVTTDGEPFELTRFVDRTAAADLAARVAEALELPLETHS